MTLALALLSGALLVLVIVLLLIVADQHAQLVSKDRALDALRGVFDDMDRGLADLHRSLTEPAAPANTTVRKGCF